MLILLFYFNNISSRLSEKKIVKGTPRNPTSTLPHRQHSHNLQAIASLLLLLLLLLKRIIIQDKKTLQQKSCCYQRVSCNVHKN